LWQDFKGGAKITDTILKESLRKCPFCSDEIKDDAKKCRFCAEWLSEDRNVSPAIPEKKTLSDLKLYNFCVIKKQESGKEEYKYESVLATNPEDARKKVAELFKGYEFHEGYGINEQVIETRSAIS
jgi:hypothetical protein